MLSVRRNDVNIALRRLNTLLRLWTGVQPRPSTSAVGSTSPPIRRLVSSSTTPVIHLSSTSALADDLLYIKASGLLPGHLVTFQAEVESECQRFKFQSSARYRADKHGQVSVQTDPSLGGTYEGVEPMGLIWSCKPIPEIAHKYPRLAKQDSTRPFNYTIRLQDDSKSEPHILASTIAERRYLADYVERILVKYGHAEGVLFLPKKKDSSDPLPVILEIRGLRNEILEDRASLLASYGYAVLALKYSTALENSGNDDVFYFDSRAVLDAFDFLTKHHRLDETRIGIFGFCTGSTLAIHSVSRLHLPVKCMVTASTIQTLKYDIGFKMPDGRLLRPYGKLDDYTDIFKKDGFTWFRSKDPEEIGHVDFKAEECLPPVENLSVPMLFLINGDDQYVPSKEDTLNLIERINAVGNGHLVETFPLDGTGHLLDAPYMPICTHSGLKFPSRAHPYFTHWGGTPVIAARSSERSWHKMLDYFRHHLKPTEIYR